MTKVFVSGIWVTSKLTSSLLFVIITVPPEDVIVLRLIVVPVLSLKIPVPVPTLVAVFTSPLPPPPPVDALNVIILFVLSVRIL